MQSQDKKTLSRINTQTIQAAKEALRRSLVDHAGNTKHEAVMAAIQTLAQLNPTPARARNAALGHES